MAQYRTATEHDATKISILGAKLYHELHYSEWVNYRPEAVEKTLLNLIEKGILLVAYEDDVILGYIGVAVVPLYLDPDTLAAEEIFWWVDESTRAKGVGEELLTRAEEAARQFGATLMSSMLNENAYKRGVGRLLESHSYRLAERTYFKVL